MIRYTTIHPDELKPKPYTPPKIDRLIPKTLYSVKPEDLFEKPKKEKGEYYSTGRRRNKLKKSWWQSEVRVYGKYDSLIMPNRNKYMNHLGSIIARFHVAAIDLEDATNKSIVEVKNKYPVGKQIIIKAKTLHGNELELQEDAKFIPSGYSFEKTFNTRVGSK